MITAHLPAGYLTARITARSGSLIMVGLAGGIFPDLDLIWFYTVDDRQIHHHHYWVHIPGFWLMLAPALLLIIRLIRPTLLLHLVVFLCAIGVHICLDSIAGDIKWLWPFSNQFYSIIEVPSRWPHWILNFMLHPVFLLEVMIWGIAIYSYRRSGNYVR